jgi:hypothetical protein
MVTQIYAGRASAFFESETQLRRADSLAEFERTTLASAIAETDKQWIEKSRAAAETLTILRENLFETKYKSVQLLHLLSGCVTFSSTLIQTKYGGGSPGKRTD